MDAKKVHTVAQCPTCRCNELRRYILAGKWTEGRICSHHVVMYPEATACPYYEREPGVD